jgi:inner membrane protein
MLFRTHLAFSLLIYFLLLNFLEVPNKFLFLFFILFATIFVDVDARKSFAGNRWYLRPFQFFVTHRGFLHSILFAVLFSLCISSFSPWGGFGFFVGYISHLFLDCWTKSGVQLFWPFDFRVRGFMNSGGIFEEVIFVLFLFVDIFLGNQGFLKFTFL